MSLAEIAARRVPNYLEPEFRDHFFRRPGQGDAKKPPLHKQRVGRSLLLGQIRTIGTVNSREEWILACCLLPAFADGRSRNTHRIRGLVARDAGTTVGPESFEERVSGGSDRALGIQHADAAQRVVEVLFPGKEAALPCVPPDAVRTAILRRSGSDGQKDQKHKAEGSHAPTSIARLARLSDSFPRYRR